jgi:hypothetical protein
MTSPYGILDKREFNLSREIMRKEILNLEQMAGVKVQLWHRVVFGPICTHCKDPITGDILDTACAYCFGTGRTPGYYGPYTIWAGFSVYDKDQQQTPDGTGVRQPYAHQVRLVNCPFIRDQDIIVDPCRDKRYFVDSVKTGIEMRRIPLINDVLVKEAPVSDPIYKVGLNG